MAHAQHHAESSARRFGGVAEAYIAIHEWLDGSKIAFAGRQHRAARHHALGVFEAEQRFGRTIDNGAGRHVPVRAIAEQHIREDLGRVPSLQDWVGRIPLEPWMLGGAIDQGAPEPNGDCPVERWRAEVALGRTILGWLDWRAREGQALVRPFLDISTGHLSPATRAALDATPLDELGGTVLRGQYGWLAHTGHVVGFEDLDGVLAYASREGCDYVMFDRDGPLHPALPWFEDET
jgi:hypothetical protein